MVRDGIQKLWEGAKNNVRGNASHRSGKHDTASQQNNARSLPCTENCIPAKEGFFLANVYMEHVQTTIIFFASYFLLSIST